MEKNNKKLLRDHFKNLRLGLSEEFVFEESQKICQNFLQNLLPKIISSQQEKIFSLYLAANNEVRTDGIRNYFFQEDIKFSYPQIISKNQALNFIEAQPKQEFLPNNIYKKVLEPNSGTKLIPNALIIPLLAFDNNMNRLGMGGGFFDRTIEEIKSQNKLNLVIGLAYDFQRSTQLIEVEEHDQKLDFIVTSKDIFFS